MGISQGLSSALKPGVCTSSTRPAAPYEGQMIYETDTDRVLVWNGVGWYANWNTSWGIVAIQELAGGTVFSSGANPVTLASITFTHVAGRRIEIRAYGRLSYSGSTNVAIALRDGATGLTYWDYPTQSYWAGVVSRIVASSSSSKTYDVRFHMAATQALTVADNFALAAIDLGAI